MNGKEEDKGEEVGQLRIGELGRRVGVSAELLRAWERRYGLLTPSRTAGGFRLYDERDEQRVRRMLAHIEGGLSAAEAARIAVAEGDERAGAAAPGVPASEPAAEHLRSALDSFDEAGVHAALDRLLAAFSVETVLRDAVLPYLDALGARWRRGEASIAQEHFASALLRGRLLGLARGWGTGTGPLALLACVPGDQHDLGLTCFGLALRGQGWRITFLGPNTPFASIAETARLLHPTLVVLTATLPEQLVGAAGGLLEVAAAAPLALAGDGVDPGIAEQVGATHLVDDPVSAAAHVAASARGRPRTAARGADPER